MARAFVSFARLASWGCGAAAQLTALVCSPWPRSESSGWQQPCQHTGRAKTSGAGKKEYSAQRSGMFMSSAQVGACKPAVKRDNRVQCRDSGERHVLVGEDVSGTRNGKWLGRKDRRKRAELCRGLESFSGLGRFGETMEDFWWCWVMVYVCSLLLPSPRESVPSHKWRGEGEEGEDMEISNATSLSFSSHPGEIHPPAPAPHPDPNHRAVAHPAMWGERETCSEGSSAGSDSRSPSLPGERTGKSRQKSQSCGSQGRSKFYSHWQLAVQGSYLLCLCLNFAPADLKVKGWFKMINHVCVSTRNKGYLLALETGEWAEENHFK